MKIKHFFLLLITLIFMSFMGQKDLSKKVDKEIKETFKVASYTYSPIIFPLEVYKELPSNFQANNFFGIKENNKIIGYIYMGKAPSKTDTFDYLVLLDKEQIVLKTKIIAYREDYGGEIGSKRWLQQFIGKKSSDDLRYGDNIAVISGATISVRSMTNSMNDFLKSLKILQSKKLL